MVVVATAFLLAVAGIAAVSVFKTDRKQLANSIAVLPFQNVSGDQTTDYLCDGRIVVEGTKVVAIDPEASPVTYDLRSLTVLPSLCREIRSATSPLRDALRSS